MSSRGNEPLQVTASRGWTLETPLRYLPGVGPARAACLERLELGSVRDLLRHYPRRHEDRRRVSRVEDAAEGETLVLGGHLRSLREKRLRGGRRLLTGRLDDDTGSIELVWFNQSYLAEWLRAGVFLHVFGTVRSRRGVLQIVSPEFEVDTGADDVEGEPSLHLQRIVPVYQLTRGLNQRSLRRLVYRVLESGVEAGRGPADELMAGAMSLGASYRAIHFPADFEEVRAARRRLVFDEFFRFGTHLWFRRRAFRSGGGLGFRVPRELDRKIRALFPFRLTADQDRAVADVVSDLSGGEPMYRLLQGDVGTGKTAVALYAILVAVRHGYQGAIMAPTEILAEQHHRTVTRLLARHPVRVGLLTGSSRAAERREVLDGLSRGEIHIVVGTHALAQDTVEFARLGVAVVDEQHRFGVRERQRIRRKGRDPHILVMTATPIPRSLCMTCYGDLDLSVLRERPPGRKPVETRLVPAAKRPAAIDFVRRELGAGRQAYFVYPLIEESEALDLPAAIEGRRRLETELRGFSVGLVHGKLSAQEKEGVLDRFRRGELSALVTTVVVEVGIDVPNATVLFIEDATRFGLAQLHQLRGRVGRGSAQSYCLVGVGGARSAEARARLRAFASIDDGFRLAEEDLKLRGPGDYLGLRQSGWPRVVSGNPLEDLDEFLRVRRLAEEFWKRPGAERYLSLWEGFGSVREPGGEEFFGLD